MRQLEFGEYVPHPVLLDAHGEPVPAPPLVPGGDRGPPMPYPPRGSADHPNLGSGPRAAVGRCADTGTSYVWCSHIHGWTARTSVVSVRGSRTRTSWRVESYAPPAALSITGRTVFGAIGMALGRAVRADVRGSVATLADLVR